jgi:hypothetical protein
MKTSAKLWLAAAILATAKGARAEGLPARALIVRPTIERLQPRGSQVDKLAFQKNSPVGALKRTMLVREPEFRLGLVRAERRATTIKVQERPVGGRRQPELQYFGAAPRKGSALGRTYSLVTPGSRAAAYGSNVRDTMH